MKACVSARNYIYESDDLQHFFGKKLLVAWLLWKERNQRVFQRKSQTVSELVALILDEAKVWAYAGHTHFSMLFPEFSQTPPSVAHLATGRDTFLL